MTPRENTHALIGDLAEPYGISLLGVLGFRRTRPYSVVRQAAYSAVRAARPAMSLPEIGRVFSNRDHTTILYGIRMHRARMAWAEFLMWAATPEDDDQLDLFEQVAA